MPSVINYKAIHVATFQSVGLFSFFLTRRVFFAFQLFFELFSPAGPLSPANFANSSSSLASPSIAAMEKFA